MGKNKVTQFSLLTLSAGITVVAVGMAVLRLGFENWQAATAIAASLVFFVIVLKTRSSKHRSILLSIPAVLLWLGVGGFLLKWYRAWATNSLEPGLGTSWLTLYIIFAIATLAVASGLWNAVSAWTGKSKEQWQVASIVAGFMFLWSAVGD